MFGHNPSGKVCYLVYYDFCTVGCEFVWMKQRRVDCLLLFLSPLNPCEVLLYKMDGMTSRGLQYIGLISASIRDFDIGDIS